MDNKTLWKNAIKIRKCRRLVTEINQLIPSLEQNKGLKDEVPKLKEAMNGLIKFIVDIKKSMEFECNFCKNKVEVGKCTVCKKNYLIANYKEYAKRKSKEKGVQPRNG